MINQVILVGRMTRDLELRYTSNEKAVGNFTLAINRKYKDENGKYVTDFIDCVIFGKGAETLSKYSKKGDLISVEGSIQKRTYQDKENNKKYITEVIIENFHFLQQNKKEDNPYKDMSVKVEASQQFEIDDSDLPF